MAAPIGSPGELLQRFVGKLKNRKSPIYLHLIFLKNRPAKNRPEIAEKWILL
jgi:hypothetical protein